MAANPRPQHHFYEIYRRTSIGLALTDALDSYITEQRIDPPLAIKMLQTFDRVVAQVLNEEVTAGMNIKGRVASYRLCDDVWTWVIEDVRIALNSSQKLRSDSVKIVAMNDNRSAGV
ncbi:transcription initiation factor IIA, gamma subunit [Trichodelitschia bisporula]|uniref:Transcription initiation factor IIA subunit 2 n=1 Tax=Trichodelitschia bisporula TaxID=703511 RepID=A0A6G1I5L1_9PEZI|nr:transcription initiation factor IIA, gamma subunit [Trichodelitschia bisporula]